LNVAVSKKQNAAWPNILAGGIAYQNWASNPQHHYASKERAKALISEPGREHRCRDFLAVIFLNYLHRGSHVTSDLEHPNSAPKCIHRIEFRKL
jgi:hypothetical protein